MRSSNKLYDSMDVLEYQGSSYYHTPNIKCANYQVCFRLAIIDEPDKIVKRRLYRRRERAKYAAERKMLYHRIKIARRSAEFIDRYWADTSMMYMPKGYLKFK